MSDLDKPFDADGFLRWLRREVFQKNLGARREESARRHLSGVRAIPMGPVETSDSIENPTPETMGGLRLVFNRPPTKPGDIKRLGAALKRCFGLNFAFVDPINLSVVLLPGNPYLQEKQDLWLSSPSAVEKDLRLSLL